MRHATARRLAPAIAILLGIGLLGATPPAAAFEPPSAPWRWPVEGPREVVDPFRAPPHEYGPGHRGVDLPAPVGSVIQAPAPGLVAFRGTVVDRPLLTIEHDGGYLTTFEPLVSELSPGESVVAGQPLGLVSVGGHTAPGLLHLGVRWNNAYINPMILFGEVPRAVLLPCCATP